MSRGLNAANATAVEADVVIPILLVRLDFESAPILAASAPFNLSFDWDGDGMAELFLGVGEFGSISDVEEGAEVQSYSITLGLSGVPQENLSTALGEHYQGRDCRVWCGFFDQNYSGFVDDPELIFRGRIDVMEIDLVKQTIDLSAHSRLRDWERARVSRLTNEEQQNRFPSDRGLEFVAQMEEKQLVWGVT